MLTPKQYKLLLHIQEQTAQNGYAPSYDEMRDAMGLRSKSGIHRLVCALETRGYIRRLPNKARAIEIVHNSGQAAVPSTQAMPQGIAQGTPTAHTAPTTQGTGATGLATGLANGLASQLRSAAEAIGDKMQVPLYGTIAAGSPIEAIQQNGGFVEVPANMVGRGEHYALKVSGDSMTGEGILDGDIVVIESCETPNNGDIVVALIEQAEVTLKRLRRRNDAIALEPANSNYETRILPPDRVQFQGRLVGLIRTYN